MNDVELRDAFEKSSSDTQQNRQTSFINYLTLIVYPNGLEFPYGYLKWDVVIKLSWHLSMTGENQLNMAKVILSTLAQVQNAKDAFSYDDDGVFSDLFEGNLCFSPEDIFCSDEYTELIQHYECVIKFNKTKEGKYAIRRSNASKVTSRKDVRDFVFRRDNYSCKMCDGNEDLTIDHIIPVKLGGDDVIENFQTLCRRCNSSKGDKILTFHSKD